MYVRFKRDLLENQNYNYFNTLLYIAILYLTSMPVNFWKIAPIHIAMVIFTKHYGNALFKPQRHEVANIFYLVGSSSPFTHSFF